MSVQSEALVKNTSLQGATRAQTYVDVELSDASVAYLRQKLVVGGSVVSCEHFIDMFSKMTTFLTWGRSVRNVVSAHCDRYIQKHGKLNTGLFQVRLNWWFSSSILHLWDEDVFSAMLTLLHNNTLRSRLTVAHQVFSVFSCLVGPRAGPLGGCFWAACGPWPVIWIGLV